ncbi:hypothetical protein MKEN_00151100 [Mycena kentingensis (nom. inval.)]|nr:hypothetical protein MKEN_00151100 [Mycena kentingensis (nom. inval.)]
MQISGTFLAVITIVAVAVASPTSAPEHALEKRSKKCTIATAGARCRKSANTDADIVGTFAKGQVKTFGCWTLGEAVDGEAVWVRTNIDGVRCFVSDTLIVQPCVTGQTASFGLC